MTETVGVVVPAYNAGRFLADTLRSVAAQTRPADRVVVVDDGSTDDTAAVAAQFAHVNLVRQANAGVGAARNRGVREITTDWVAFLDADDLWHPEKLQLQLEAARESGADSIFCGLDLIDAEGAPVSSPPSPAPSFSIEDLLLHAQTIPQGTSSTLLVRRATFDAAGGYDEGLATMADWDLLIRLRERSEFAHVSRSLVSYRRYAGSMSRSVAMLDRESRLVLDKAFASRKGSPWNSLERRSRAWNDLVLSGSYFGVGDVRRAIAFGWRAVVRDPRLSVRILSLPLRRMRRRRQEDPSAP